MPFNLVGFVIFLCCICCLYCSCWNRLKKAVGLEKFDNICDYYTGSDMECPTQRGIGVNGCATKSYCTSCNNKNRSSCSMCRNCVYMNNTCVPGDFNGPYNQQLDYEYYEYDIPYDFNIPVRRQTDLRYDYKYKII